MTGFWICAGLMLAVAAALLLRPLLRTDLALRERGSRLAALDAALAAGVIDADEYATKHAASSAPAGAEVAQRSPLLLPFALGLALTIAAVSLYRVVGEPRAFDASVTSGPNTSAPAMEEAVRGLEARLRDAPKDLEGWLLLGRAYKAMQRFDDARATLAKALELAPDDPDAMVEYAEAIALAAPEHRIAGEARTLLDRALAANPANQRGLWMLGIAEVQEQRHAEAIAVWERLLAQLPSDSDVAASVREQIEQARQAGGLAAPTGATAAANTPEAEPAPATADATRAALTVEVDVAPELKARIAPGDVLFVFARAPQGPKMPLAIQRLPATGFPLRLTLDDSMGMMPALKLSQAERVVVGARISKSGNASPQSGDFEIISEPIALQDQALPVTLTISNVVP